MLQQEVGFPIDQVSKLNIISAATFPLKCTSFLTSIIKLVFLFILQCKYDFIVSVISLQLNNLKQVSELRVT